MSVVHFVDRPNHLVISKLSGRVTPDEITASLKKLRGDPDFRPHFRQLADLSQVSSIDLRRADLTQSTRVMTPSGNKPGAPSSHPTTSLSESRDLTGQSSKAQNSRCSSRSSTPSPGCTLRSRSCRPRACEAARPTRISLSPSTYPPTHSELIARSTNDQRRRTAEVNERGTTAATRARSCGRTAQC
jgi:hypothetical protein